MGESLGSMNAKELKNLESKLEKGISRIRSKKVYMSCYQQFILCTIFERIDDLIYIS